MLAESRVATTYTAMEEEMKEAARAVAGTAAVEVIVMWA